MTHYTIRITLSLEEIARLGSVKLVPGIPSEAFVHTGERTHFLSDEAVARQGDARPSKK
jgi:hypothetical protein